MQGIYLYFEIIGLLTSLILYLKKRNKLLLYFIPFLVITVSVELVAWVLTSKNSVSGYLSFRYAMYNIFTALEFLFYSFLFYIHLKKPVFKKIVYLFFPVYSILVLINFLFVQGLTKTFHTYTFLLGSFFLVVFCCLYFYESVQPDKVEDQLSKQPFFWISSGLLIYYLGSVIINALFQYLTTNDLRIEGQKIYSIINNSLNVILYSSFCIAFFLCRNHRKKSL
jgi:hypothetical protein